MADEELATEIIVKAAIAETLMMDIEEIDLEDNLCENLSMDSLDCVMIDICMEEKYGLKIPDSTWDKVKTVGQLVKAADDALEFLRRKEEIGRSIQKIKE